jgi:hypothetical protein
MRCQCAMTPAVIAHLRIADPWLGSRHGMVVRGRGTGNRRPCPGDWCPRRALDLAPQIARARGRFGEHSRGVLELRARHAVPAQNHPPARVLHGRVERAVGLHAAKLPERTDERRIRHAQAGRAAAAAANHERTDEGDTQRQTGAYHAARLGTWRGKVNAAPCGRIVDKNRVSRQHDASGWEPVLPIRHSVSIFKSQIAPRERLETHLITYLST